MKHLIIGLFLCAGIIAIPACTKTQQKEALCSAGQAAAVVVSTKISADLACSNPEAVRASVEAKLVDLKICEKKEGFSTMSAKSVVADAVCAPVIEAIFTGALAQIPAEWGCSGGTLAADAKAKLIESCSKAF